jgi:transposase
LPDFVNAFQTQDTRELCDGLRRGFYRSVLHVPSPGISDLRTTLSRRRHFIRIQTAEVNAVKRLLRGVGRNSGRRGSLAQQRALAELARWLELPRFSPKGSFERWK